MGSDGMARILNWPCPTNLFQEPFEQFLGFFHRSQRQFQRQFLRYLGLNRERSDKQRKSFNEAIKCGLQNTDHPMPPPFLES